MSWLKQSNDENTQRPKARKGCFQLLGLSLLGIGLMTFLGLGADSILISKPEEKEREIISLLFGGLSQLWEGNSSLW